MDQSDRLANRKEKKTRTDKGLLSDPRPFPYPLHYLSFPFVLKTIVALFSLRFPFATITNRTNWITHTILPFLSLSPTHSPFHRPTTNP